MHDDSKHIQNLKISRKTQYRKNGIMDNSRLWGIVGSVCSIFVSSSLLFGDVKNDIDIRNTCATVRYDKSNRLDNICDHLGNLVQNPYSSPDYLFQQLEQISLYVKHLTGKQFQIKSVIQHVNDIYKYYTGNNIDDKWMKSLVGYASKRDGMINHHNYCYLGEEEDRFCFEDVANISFCPGFAVGDFADRGDLMKQIHDNREISPWTIDDVPPKITIGVVLTAAGYTLGAIACPEAVVIATTMQVIGVGLIVEHTVTTCQKSYDDKQQKRKKEKGYVDIREPYQPEGVIDIRQRDIGR